MLYYSRQSETEVDSTFVPDNQREYTSYYEENLKPSSLHRASSQQSIEHNDFYDELVELEGTLHKNFVHIKKKYTIFVQQTSLLKGGHHAIVISDGVNDAITFELMVISGKANAIISGGRTIAKVVVYRGDMNGLTPYGEVTCTLYELTKTAADVLNSNRQYNWLSNNCQHFCTRFLESNDLPTYTTDIRKVATGVAVGTAAAATAAICSIQ